ncbi:PTS sugar transporter subunit IIC [Longibaculum muris]|uniref:PTS sugar transporter subunit IIC n=1 Tax=Longibaculum muris TaxID=1796628 RepID=UPI00189E9434|nr:PTS transporter subunit EIIC [Longibaculum muris]
MNTFQEKLEKVLVPIAEKLSKQRHLAAVRDAMGILIPLTIIGGFAILLAQPPVNPETMRGTNFFYQFLLAWYDWSHANSAILMIPYNLTLGAISLYVVGAVAYRLSGSYQLPKLESAFTAILTFLAIAAAPIALENGTFMNMSNLGAGGMFTAIIVALLTVEITNVFVSRNITIKMPASVPPNVASPFKILIPMAINVVGFILLNTLCTSLTGDGLANLLTNLLQPLLSATESLPSILILLLISQLFWFFGIHGDNMVGAVVTPIITMNVALNLEAYNAGQPMTHIFAGQFNGVWGGWCTYIALLIAMILVGKSQQIKALCKLAPLSTAFNINEPLVFGVPTVLNVFTLIPTLVCTVINICVAYGATYFGLIGKTYLVLPWTTPAPLAAFLSTMDWKALVLWIILCAIDVLIIIPFMRNYDKQLLAEESH